MAHRCARWACSILALSILPGVWGQEPAMTDGTDMLTLAPTPVASASYTPLTPHERWHGYLHETFLGTEPALQIFGTALLDHIGHAPTQWGVGSHGYSHRLENRFYSTMIDGSVHASLATLLHQDTRYLRAHDRRVGRRMGQPAAGVRCVGVDWNLRRDHVADVQASARIRPFGAGRARR